MRSQGTAPDHGQATGRRRLAGRWGGRGRSDRARLGAHLPARRGPVGRELMPGRSQKPAAVRRVSLEVRLHQTGRAGRPVVHSLLSLKINRQRSGSADRATTEHDRASRRQTPHAIYRTRRHDRPSRAVPCRPMPSHAVPSDRPVRPSRGSLSAEASHRLNIPAPDRHQNSGRLSPAADAGIPARLRADAGTNEAHTQIPWQRGRAPADRSIHDTSR